MARATDYTSAHDDRVQIAPPARGRTSKRRRLHGIVLHAHAAGKRRGAETAVPFPRPDGLRYLAISCTSSMSAPRSSVSLSDSKNDTRSAPVPVTVNVTRLQLVLVRWVPSTAMR